MFADQNSVSCFIDQNGISIFVDQNGILLTCGAVPPGPVGVGGAGSRCNPGFKMGGVIYKIVN